MDQNSHDSETTRPALVQATALYEAILGRPIDAGAISTFAGADDAEHADGFNLAMRLTSSSEFVDRLVRRAIDAHLFLIHRARDVMIRRLLPPAESIIDLGGINAPLFHMGYKHPFERMVIVDLPSDDRHDMYRDIPFNAAGPARCPSIIAT